MMQPPSFAKTTAHPASASGPTFKTLLVTGQFSDFNFEGLPLGVWYLFCNAEVVQTLPRDGKESSRDFA